VAEAHILLPRVRRASKELKVVPGGHAQLGGVPTLPPVHGCCGGCEGAGGGVEAAAVAHTLLPPVRRANIALKVVPGGHAQLGGVPTLPPVHGCCGGGTCVDALLRQEPLMY
jgi:hypothetical protein